VAAPSLIPRKAGERIKTDGRDSEKLAVLHRAGDLTAVWVPDPTHEALRDLVRARVDASMHLMRAKQQLCAFLLRHRRIYTTGKCWTQRHRLWLAKQTFELDAHQVVFQDYVETVWTAKQEKGRSDEEDQGDNDEMVPKPAGRSTAQLTWDRSSLGGDFGGDDWRSQPV
jgi:transposase